MDLQSHTITQDKTNVRMPSRYGVIIHNDDVTSMDFVVEILVKIFHKSSLEAAALMMAVHNDGQGVAGIYTYDIALTKKYQAEQRAAEKSFPLVLSLWEVET